MSMWRQYVREGIIGEGDAPTPVSKIRVTSQNWVREYLPGIQWQNERSMCASVGFLCSKLKVACKDCINVWFTGNIDFVVSSVAIR